MIITGATRMTGLIGSDVTNSMSPFIHNFLSKKIGKDAVYSAFNVSTNQLENAVKGAYALGFAGLNVTSPHKIAVMEYTTSLDKSAQKAYAVNLLKYTDRGFVGYNTDIDGILLALREHHKVPRPKTVTILGTGGASNAAVIALNDADVTVISRKEAERGALCNISGDLFIQATSGTPEELLHLAPPHLLTNFTTIFDMNYPKHNPWLQQVKTPENKVFDGLAMLVYQAIRSYEIIWHKNISYELAQELLYEIIDNDKENRNGHS
ncbi:MAG: hypothetical protein FWD97_01200 [Defluviitaleaceae bacterium]|nr:hypothetical protein [Defluviitaleaceae bacterium]